MLPRLEYPNAELGSLVSESLKSTWRAHCESKEELLWANLVCGTVHSWRLVLWDNRRAQRSSWCLCLGLVVLVVTSCISLPLTFVLGRQHRIVKCLSSLAFKSTKAHIHSSATLTKLESRNFNLLASANNTS